MSLPGYFGKGIKIIFPQAEKLVENWKGRCLSFEVSRAQSCAISAGDLARLATHLGVAMAKISIKIASSAELDTDMVTKSTAIVMIEATHCKFPPPAPEPPKA